MLPHAVSVAFDCVSFFMGDAGKTIRVDVSGGLLACIAGRPPRERSEYLECLRRHKYLFAHIAALKYVGGHYALEVRVRVARITTDDVADGQLVGDATAIRLDDPSTSR
jgi:hypothetical protein